MKKAVVIIAVLFAICTAGISVYAENTAETELLNALGITFDAVEADEAVTRGEFAQTVLEFMNVESVSSVYDASFEDVTEYNEECDAVYYLKSRNILNGAGDGNFYPEQPITKKQAAIVIARVLGYGGISGDIEKHASALGITGMSNDALTHGELAPLLYKALFCECVVIKSAGTITEYELVENYLSETYGVYKAKGIVSSNSLTTLDGNGEVLEDTIIIGSHRLFYNGKAMDEYLGFSVDYYYVGERWNKNEEGADVLLCAVPSSVNSVTEIAARDIVSFDGKTLVYSEGNRNKTYIVEPVTDVIYNGIAWPDYDETKISPVNGKLTIVENGSNVDCIKVESYVNAIVSSSDDEGIYLKNREKIDFDSFEENELFIFDSDGNASAEVPANSVISLYYSADEDVLKAVFSTVCLDGVTVSKVSDDYITIGEADYYIDRNYTNWKTVLGNIGNSTYRVYIDACGEIAKIEKASGGVSFGFIISVFENNDTELPCINLLTEDGSIEAFECVPKPDIDGDRRAYSKSSMEKKLTLNYTQELKQLVTYKTNSEGKITAVATAMNRTTFNDSVDDKNIEGFKISYKVEADEYYKTASKIFGTSCPVDEFTKVFFISDNPEKQSKEYYWTGDISALENDTKATSGAVGYTTTAQFKNAEALVVYGGSTSGKITSGARLSAVKEIEIVANEDGEERTRITFVTAGKLVAYNLNEEAKAANASLSKGDLVRFAIDRNYEVSEIETLCDLRNDGTMVLKYGQEQDYVNTKSNPGEVTFRVVSGGVYDYSEGILCLSRGGLTSIDVSNPGFEYYSGIKNAFISVIDGDEITAGSEADIVAYNDNPYEYSGAFVTTRLGAVVDVAIYKKQ